MRYLKSNKLYCFSPPVMIATFFIEVALALCVLLRYKLTPITRLAAAIMVFLAIFQLAEYNVCEGSWGVDSLRLARIGYVSITLLPPLGLHLATYLTGKRRPIMMWVVYSIATVFMTIFLFVGNGMQSQECLGNYVIFKIAPWVVQYYAMYYYGLMLFVAGYALQAAQSIANQNHKKSVHALVVGYSAFIIPTTLVNIIDPSTIAGIPSIMCGFAVILAITLAGIVLPRYYFK